MLPHLINTLRISNFGSICFSIFASFPYNIFYIFVHAIHIIIFFRFYGMCKCFRQRLDLQLFPASGIQVSKVVQKLLLPENGEHLH